MLHNSQNILADADKEMPAPDATSASISREQLQEHWLRLRIKRSTLLYLQQVLDQQGTSIHAHIDPGVAMALIATRALATEKRGKSVLKEGEGFLAEELRQTFIEGLGQHCVETLRILLGTLAALQLHLFRPPLFWPGAVSLLTGLAFSLIVLLVYVGCIIARSQWQTQRGSTPTDVETPSQANTTASSASFVCLLATASRTRAALQQRRMDTCTRSFEQAPQLASSLFREPGSQRQGGAGMDSRLTENH